jgi:hypothetical protein
MQQIAWCVCHGKIAGDVVVNAVTIGIGFE